MNINRTSIATAISFALFGFAAVAQAQQTTGTTPRDDVEEKTLDAIEVRGIRSSLEKSLEGKRNEDSVVELITAEDVGKMPDKNVADSLARVPGVTTQSQSGGSGGFDEKDRAFHVCGRQGMNELRIPSLRPPAFFIGAEERGHALIGRIDLECEFCRFAHGGMIR